MRLFCRLHIPRSGTWLIAHCCGNYLIHLPFFLRIMQIMARSLIPHHSLRISILTILFLASIEKCQHGISLSSIFLGLRLGYVTSLKVEEVLHAKSSLNEKGSKNTFCPTLTSSLMSTLSLQSNFGWNTMLFGALKCI